MTKDIKKMKTEAKYSKTIITTYLTNQRYDSKYINRSQKFI